MTTRLKRSLSGNRSEDYEDYTNYIDLDDSTTSREEEKSTTRSRSKSKQTPKHVNDGRGTPSPLKRRNYSGLSASGSDRSLSQRSLSNKSLSRNESNYNIYDFSLYGAKVKSSSERINEYLVERNGMKRTLSGQIIQTKYGEITDELRLQQLRLDEPLYCEGGPNTYWRGRLHKYIVALAPLALAYGHTKAETMTEFYATVLLTITLMLCFGLSFLYHQVEWSPKTEVLLQKIDHVGIFCLSGGTVSQYCLLSMHENRLFTLGLTWIATLYGCWKVFRLEKETYHHLISTAPVLLAVKDMFKIMTPFELTLAFGTWGQYFLGMTLYAIEWPKCWPGVFGGHEVMHILVCTAAISTYCLQYCLLHKFDHTRCMFEGEKWSLTEEYEPLLFQYVFEPLKQALTFAMNSLP